MTRVSAGAIVAQSYRFAFGSFLTILGIIWLPLAIELVGAYFLMTPYLAAIGELLAHLPKPGDAPGLPVAFSDSMQSMYRYAIVFMVVGMFLRAVMMLGITKQALGLRTGPAFVYFAIGKDVWRLFGAYFIFYVLIQIAVFAVIMVILIPAVIVGIIGAVIVSAAHLQGAALNVLIGLGVVALVVVLYGAMFYVILRLGFLLTPIVVAEKKIDIARIWNLGKGNVWRMFLISLGIFVPIMIVYVVALIAIVFSLHWPTFLPIPSGDPQAAAAAVNVRLAAVLNTLRNAWPMLLPLMVIFATLYYGMVGGAIAFTYRALVPKEATPAVT